MWERMLLLQRLSAVLICSNFLCFRQVSSSEYSQASYYGTMYLLTHCELNKTQIVMYDVRNSTGSLLRYGLLQGSHSAYPALTDCVLTINTGPDTAQRVAFTLEANDMCNGDDKFEVYEGKSNDSMSPPILSVHSGTSVGLNMTSVTNFVTIRFTSLHGCTDASIIGFKLRYTIFRTGNECAVDTEFPCKNTHCINNELACDGFDNCGDNSDETDYSCNPTKPTEMTTPDTVLYIDDVDAILNEAMFAALALVVVVFIGFLAFCIFASRNRKEQSRKQASYENEVANRQPTNRTNNFANNVAVRRHEDHTTENFVMQENAPPPYQMSISYPSGPPQLQGNHHVSQHKPKTNKIATVKNVYQNHSAAPRKTESDFSYQDAEDPQEIPIPTYI